MNLDDAVVVALGGNLGQGGGPARSSAEVLEEALGRFASIGLIVARRSSLWRSAAWPDPAQPDYVNAVALVQTPLDAWATLETLQSLERAFGRLRSTPNASRVLDLDLIAHGRTVLSAPTADATMLTLPHPRAAARGFVMGPLAEIAPQWRHPTLGSTALELARDADVGRDARPIHRPV